MVIVETPIFTKQVLDTLSGDEYRLFQWTLLEHPDAGTLISGSGGLRKLRWLAEGRGKRNLRKIRPLCYRRSSSVDAPCRECACQRSFRPSGH